MVITPHGQLCRGGCRPGALWARRSPNLSFLVACSVFADRAATFVTMCLAVPHQMHLRPVASGLTPQLMRTSCEPPPVRLLTSARFLLNNLFAMWFKHLRGTVRPHDGPQRSPLPLSTAALSARHLDAELGEAGPDGVRAYEEYMHDMVGGRREWSGCCGCCGWRVDDMSVFFSNGLECVACA